MATSSSSVATITAYSVREWQCVLQPSSIVRHCFAWMFAFIVKTIVRNNLQIKSTFGIFDNFFIFFCKNSEKESERKNMTWQSKTIPDVTKFLIGGSAGILTTLIVQPLDFLKTRMQISDQDVNHKSYRNSYDAVRKITQNEGILTIYSGLTAALLRQATYTTVRLGIYTSLYEKLTVDNQQPSLVLKLMIAMIAGIVGSFVGTPAEIALIRMTADGILPDDHKRNYKNVFHALICITKEDGIFGLWKSAVPTMIRGLVYNFVQLASYSQMKQIILETKGLEDGIRTHFLASVFSGFNTAIISLPVDIVKTRMQNMRNINGIPEYSSCWNTFSRIFKNEGFHSLWKGFAPYFLKIVSNTVIMFIIFEQLSAAYKSFFILKHR